MRFGEGGAGIDRVEILDEHGQPIETIRTGDHCIFRVHWWSDGPVEQPVWRLEFHTSTGQVIAAANTRYHHQVPECIEGHGFIDYDVPKLHLVAGSYDISATLFDFECQQPFDVRHRFHPFRVEHGFPRDSDAIVSLGGAWHGDVLPDAPPRSEHE
jgi:hypothetical protein